MSLLKKLRNLFKNNECNCKNCKGRRAGKYIGYMPCQNNTPISSPPQKK